MDIAVDTVSDIIVRLRAVEVKEADTDPDSGSNPTDDGATDVLMSGGDDATEAEVRAVIRSLNDDERGELLALLYIGRGDFEGDDWDEAVRFARERQQAGDGAVKELMSTPNAADLLGEGLEAIGQTPPVSQT